MTVGGSALTSYSSISGLAGATQGWYWDPVQQLTHVKVASSTSTRSVVLTGVDKAAYEAEFASGSGTSTNTNHTGYTGTGFVDSFDASGDSVTFDTHVSTAGIYQVTLRYANATGGTATRTVTIDGTVAGTVSMPSLANWDTWATANLSVSLGAGHHTISISWASGDSGAINLDSLSLVRP